MPKTKLFEIGTRGVNVTSKPQDLDFTELVSAQNAEVVSDGGDGALTQRPGMVKMNDEDVIKPSTTSTASQVDVIRAVDADFEAAMTKQMYASKLVASDAAAEWRRTSTGASWTDSQIVGSGNLRAASNQNTNIALSALRGPKAVTLGKKFYYYDDNFPIQINEYFDGTNTILSTVPQTIVGTTIATPSDPTVTYTGERNPLLLLGSVSAVYVGTTFPLPTPSAPTVTGVNTGGDSYNNRYKIVNISGSFNSAASEATFKQTSNQQQTIISNETTYARDVYRTEQDPEESGHDVAPYIGKIGQIAAGSTTLVDGDGTDFTDGDGASPPSASSGASYSYKVVAVGTHGALSAASSTMTVSNAASTLSASNYVKISGSTASGVASYKVYRTSGGSTQGLIGTFTAGSSLNDTGLAGDGTSAPSSANPSSGTTYTYKVVAIAPDGSYSIASSATSYTTGYSALSTSDYTTITAVDPVVAGASRYDVYRTAGGGSTGKIGIIDISSGSRSLDDTGLAGDSSSAPGSASGTNPGDALGVLDMITDGSNLILAVYDAPATDPDPNGRILQFNPQTGLWSQIVDQFPIGSDNGTASALCMYGGALHYGTYIGTTNGNTSAVKSTQQPIPFGGVSTTYTTAASLTVMDILPFKGKLYVATASLVAATAALVLEMDQDGTWGTALTATHTEDENAFTSLWTFDGKLFAGHTSPNAATPTLSIWSTEDGSTWTEEVDETTFSYAPQIVGQAVEFDGKCYVVLGRTTSSGSTYDSGIIKRVAGTGTGTNVWSSALATSGYHLSGALAISYST